MKKITMAAVLCFMLAGQVLAQDVLPRNVLKIAPLGTVNKIRLGYERVVSHSASGGAVASLYYGVFPGLKVEPYLRIYFGNTAPEGFYMQGKGSIGFFNSMIPFVETREVYNAAGEFQFEESGINLELQNDFTTTGAGFGVGYQTLLGNQKNISIDVQAGLNYNTFPYERDEKIRETTFDADGNRIVTTRTPRAAAFIWNTTGPGSYFNGMFTIGYAF